MSEATGPLPAIAGPAALIAVTEQAIAEIRAAQELLRRDIEVRGDLTELVMFDRRLADIELEIRTARRYELTRDILQPPALAAVPEPRHRNRKGTSRQRAPGDGQMKLFRVPSLVLVAFAAIRGAARAHRIAAALTAVTLPAAVGVGGAVIIHRATTQGPYGAGAGVGVSAPGWHTSASPIPSSSLAGLTKPKPKAKRGKDGKTLLAAGGLLPTYGPAPAPSSSPSSPSASPVVSAAVGPATLEVAATSLDLSVNSQAILSLSATGTGWVSWKITAGGTDLAFSPDHGVLQAGQSVEVTVSVDLAAQALDGNTSQTFSVGGQSVTVSLPALVSSVLPSVAPSVLPSVLPSL